jgi:hypothetical protein
MENLFSGIQVWVTAINSRSLPEKTALRVEADQFFRALSIFLSLTEKCTSQINSPIDIQMTARC